MRVTTGQRLCAEQMNGVYSTLYAVGLHTGRHGHQGAGERAIHGCSIVALELLYGLLPRIQVQLKCEYLGMIQTYRRGGVSVGNATSPLTQARQVW